MTDDSPSKRAHVQLMTKLADASDYEANLLEEIAAGASFDPGELVHLLRRTRMNSLAALTAGVYFELASGHSWAQIAEGLGVTADLAEDLYGPGYAAWCVDGAPRVAPLPGHHLRPAGRWPADLAQAWEKLSSWRRRRAGRLASR